MILVNYQVAGKFTTELRRKSVEGKLKVKSLKVNAKYVKLLTEMTDVLIPSKAIIRKKESKMCIKQNVMFCKITLKIGFRTIHMSRIS